MQRVKLEFGKDRKNVGRRNGSFQRRVVCTGRRSSISNIYRIAERSNKSLTVKISKKQRPSRPFESPAERLFESSYWAAARFWPGAASQSEEGGGPFELNQQIQLDFVY